MLLKKAEQNPPQFRFQSRKQAQELEVLYARRSAIDALIESLQNYDRYRAQRPDGDALKSA